MATDFSAPEVAADGRIVWTRGKFGVWRGAVNGNDLFTMARGTSQADPRWQLVTLLPGALLEPDVHEDEQVLRDSAWTALKAHVHTLGAVFPEEVPAPLSAAARR
ncbi:hypothetical protein ETD86_45760 [Nonomuraea turkmeniaca]|uniref:Uncharacterized protein n=1 Tax=Nonomuraea turkmeniaca TaxID=103838 RepID=A0A5S4EYU1_9ACTN|nr:hypothetical protein [Nonomuraea turkmeniaca]TMR08882.1 hypothetical protein ETD86_45760 [Nonomuraea turkmeniaca]